MISKPEIAHMEKILQELGLGIYQSRALAYLYALGRSKAADIAKASGIPRSKIYSILKELSGLRLAKQIGTKPIQFEPIDPHTGIDNLKHARKKSQRNSEAEDRRAGKGHTQHHALAQKHSVSLSSMSEENRGKNSQRRRRCLFRERVQPAWFF